MRKQPNALCAGADMRFRSVQRQAFIDSKVFRQVTKRVVWALGTLQKNSEVINEPSDREVPVSECLVCIGQR
jgi:hypothetical protein